MVKNIPPELKELKQWVCAGDDKVPKNPINGFNASPTKPNTWSSFEKAQANTNFPYIGFVITADDPYTIIDLDDPQDPKKKWSDEERAYHAALNKSIMDSFQSYTELSKSGTGVHIIVRGSIPKGVNKDTIEMYSAERYMITTGNVIKDLPIVDCQELLTRAYHKLKAQSASVDLVEVAATEEDNVVIDMAMRAVNGDKFQELANSVPDGVLNSEHDMALLSIIAFYTESNEQVRRIFRMTNRGKREKVIKNDVYLNYTLEKIRAKQAIAEADMEMGKEMAASLMNEVVDKEPIIVDEPAEKIGGDLVKNMLAKQAKESINAASGNIAALMKDKRTASQPTVVTSNLEPTDMFPPGLVGKIAQYVYESAPRPVPEIGLMASLGYIAGFIGQRYNVYNTGLNLYLILLAKTGTGKEGISSGINRLNKSIVGEVPGVANFRGPGAFASAPGMIKFLAEKSSILSILGEFGLTLHELVTAKSTSPQHGVYRAMLELFQKSGKSESVGDTAYSDQDKNTGVINSPALSILGESTPSTFYDALDERLITSGLLPRFTILEYNGERPYLNENNGFAPSEDLVDQLKDLVVTVLTMYANDTILDVAFTSEAQTAVREYERYVTDLMNNSTKEVTRELWNRVHLKVLKFSALIAVGIDHHNPVIDMNCFNWSKAFVEKDIKAIEKRFEEGNVGTGESKQYQVLVKKIKAFFTKKDHKKEYKLYQDNKILPHMWLSRGLANNAAFKVDSKGATRALKDLITQFIDEGMLVELTPTQAKAAIGKTAKAYMIGSNWSMEE